MKSALSIIAVILTFGGYLPYIRDTLKGKTKPHVYTWIVWSLVTLIAFALQVSVKAGPGQFVTLAAGLVCLFIAFLGFAVAKKDLRIDKIDTVCFVLALIALVMWPFSKHPLIAIIVVSVADMLGFVPTIRKSWYKPFSETLFSYEMNTFRFVLAVLALKNYNLIALLYPLVWVIANGLFSVFLIVRRKQLA